MQKITVVTGNSGKLKEIKLIAGDKLDLSMQDLDINEIQSLDFMTIIKDKAQQAYSYVKGPVMVDDVSAGLDSLGGLPGPFIKFFNEVLGEGALYKLTKSADETVTITCIAAYYDGKTLVTGTGTIKGTVVSPRGSNGFGFDQVVMPEGYSLTMAEMSTLEKSKISHRSKAFHDLIDKLNKRH